MMRSNYFQFFDRVGIEQDRIHSSKHSKDFDIQSLSEESFFEFVHGDFTQYVSFSLHWHSDFFLFSKT